jgi:large subunit ribosomal protein L6
VEKLFVEFGKYMSRIGNKLITIPTSVKVEIKDHILHVVGPKGSVDVTLPSQIKTEIVDQTIKFARKAEDKFSKSLHGLVRSLTNNAVMGVTDGYSKDLELVGTGYRVAVQGANLSLSLGYSHPIIFQAVPGVTMAVEGNNKIKISGFNKQAVGQVAANIRKLRPPEPYKGKGIRYVGETIRRKAGKAAAKGAS